MIKAKLVLGCAGEFQPSYEALATVSDTQEVAHG
ncbi:hypothetical protein [Azospirillum largimobile]